MTKRQIKYGDTVKVLRKVWSQDCEGETDCLVEGKWKVWGDGECFGFFNPNDLQLINSKRKK